MRTLPRRVTLLLMGAALIGCVANTTHTSNSSRISPEGVGKPARSISGTDADGKSFQLSDYRGKVVLLDFWASF